MMEIFMKESGKKIKRMGRANIFTRMDPCILENGRMINNMEKQLRLGQ
jgi:hypothetical protein